MEDTGIWRALVTWMECERERERIEIARAAHDDLGLRVAMAKFALANVTGDIEPIRKLLEETARVAGQIGMRMRPGVLDAAGVGAALEWQCAEFCEASGVVCAQRQISPLVLDTEVSTGLFRISGQVLELVRESGAKSMRVVFWRQGDRVVLRLSHDGGAWLPDCQSDSGIALLWVRERARMLGGTAEIRNPSSGGATVTVTVPAAEQKAR